MNVFVVELRRHELLVALPHLLAVVREDFALQSLRHALLDEQIHRFAALRRHHERLARVGHEEIYGVDERVA